MSVALLAQDLRKTQKLPQKVSDGKDHYQLFMALSSMYIISQWVEIIFG
jgi:hypothetical protein